MTAGSRKLADLAAAVDARLIGGGDVAISRVAAVDDADPSSLTFAIDARWFAKALESQAAAVIVPRDLEASECGAKSLLAVDDVRAALARVLALFAPPRPSGEHTHPSAVVADDVERGKDVFIGAGAIVESGARLGDSVVLLSGSYVGQRASIGARTLLHPRAVVLDDCVIGADCILQACAIVGADGFGFVRVGAEQMKIPQIGNVVVGDRVEIGACACIDRAVTGSTMIGNGTKIDNLVQVGHNVVVGENCTLCGQVGIAGSTKIGDGVVAAGQAGISGHLEVGEYSLVLAQAGVTHSIPPRSRVSGFPAQPHRTTMEQQVMLRKLPKLAEQLRALTDAVEELRKHR